MQSCLRYPAGLGLFEPPSLPRDCLFYPAALLCVCRGEPTLGARQDVITCNSVETAIDSPPPPSPLGGYAVKLRARPVPLLPDGSGPDRPPSLSVPPRGCVQALLLLPFFASHSSILPPNTNTAVPPQAPAIADTLCHGTQNRIRRRPIKWSDDTASERSR